MRFTDCAAVPRTWKCSTSRSVSTAASCLGYKRDVEKTAAVAATRATTSAGATTP
ncbi:MAG: hypothetical protein ABID32_01060 [Candidatus Omnitrophota bacterium]